MNPTFRDFVTWAGGKQSKAAELIGIDKYRAHRLFHGAPLRPEEATAIETVSYGVFKRDALIFNRQPDQAA